MLTLAPIALASLFALSSAPSAEPIEHESINLNITMTDDVQDSRDAWASLDALPTSEHDALNLGGMRVGYVGLTVDTFTTDTLFTIDAGDVAYVFSKTDSHADSIPLSTFSTLEQDTLSANLPDCDVIDFDAPCLTLDDTDAYSVSF